MARYKEALCRLCRREGEKLFLKGSRCVSDKCAISRRAYAPGQHGQTTRQKKSNYGIQLREKQKVKRIYGMLERQFRIFFKAAARTKGKTGEMLLQFLERRLDNTIFRMGCAKSRQEARQIVRHSHVFVNSKKVNIPSFRVKVNDSIEIRGKESFIKMVKQTMELLEDRAVPSWLKMDKEKLSASVVSMPKREDVGFPIQEQLIVELYSK